MNTATAMGKAPARTVGTDGNGLGWVRFRTQSAAEEAWRASITPAAGQQLVMVGLSATEFEIRLVPGASPPSTAEREDASLDGLPLPELLDIAARRGVQASPKDRKADVIDRIRRK